MKTFSLTKDECAVLVQHYLNAARLKKANTSTNLALSKEPRECNGLPFLGGPLEGEPKTAENWKKRADIFAQEAKELRERANYFA